MHAHNRVKAYLDGKPLPQVFKSKCQAIFDLRTLLEAGNELVLATVWRGDGRAADSPPSKAEEN